MTDSEGKFISPCGCIGSVRHVHYDCIKRWIDISGNTHCKLCLHEFNLPQTRLEKVMSVIYKYIVPTLSVVAILSMIATLVLITSDRDRDRMGVNIFSLGILIAMTFKLLTEILRTTTPAEISY
jgi:E3 ubiquitin-protein ligase DOA10